MAKAAKEIQMENSRELETHSTETPCSPSEEQAEKPSMLCFKKRKKSCKKGLTTKDACEAASAALEEKSQCISPDQGEAKVFPQSRPSRGAWAAIKSLAKPRRRQKSSSQKVPSDSQVQLEMDTEEGCAQGLPRKKESSGVKMPCIRFSRGKKKSSPAEAVEESDGSLQANEVMGILNKAIEELEDLAPSETCGRAGSLSPLPAEEDQGPAEEAADASGKSEPLAEPRTDVDGHTECTTQSEITSSEPVNEPVQEKLPEGSPHQTAAHAEEEEVAPEAPISRDQPYSTPEITEVQEIANICKELPEGGESERNTSLPEESKSEEAAMDCSPSASKDDAASGQSSSSHQEKPETNMGTGVGIVITITEAVDSDDTDSDQAYEPSPVLHHNKQKGNKKPSLVDQGHRTSDQYELLLIETASSLVKAAIQSSIEQLVSEMALEQNKHNSFL
ncbi:AKAP5 protein, partial [Alectura lathami]|nr:AKAP5 protein [Alectura lathami]